MVTTQQYLPDIDFSQNRPGSKKQHPSQITSSQQAQMMQTQQYAQMSMQAQPNFNEIQSSKKQKQRRAANHGPQGGTISSKTLLNSSVQGSTVLGQGVHGQGVGQYPQQTQVKYNNIILNSNSQPQY